MMLRAKNLQEVSGQTKPDKFSESKSRLRAFLTSGMPQLVVKKGKRNDLEEDFGAASRHGDHCVGAVL
jgi:hypothetical protein